MRKDWKNVPGKNAGTLEYTVQEEMELLPFLLKMLVKNSRNSVKSMLARGQVTVDGKMSKQHNHLLREGQKVAILKNKAALNEMQLIGFTILHEDEDIIVVNKEAGLLTMASKNEKELTVYRQLMTYVKKIEPRNRIFIVHRLDKDTSGVLLFAKSERVKEALQSKWNTVVKERMYMALVEGVVRKKEATITSWLKESKTFKVYSSPKDNGGQQAITHYKTVQASKQFTLLEVHLETGRKNQIRVHMETIGHPIVGDKKYGSTVNPLKRLGLHAAKLAILHPRTGQLVQYEADVPRSFFVKST
ncbi:RluA family pseudouridine synthase [Sporosarcina sp. ACRSM]|uniref:RluA family pseudouridine synthase n=1 Tax=Sporosarcina sp. ACRSM TaxID=2918216 RepID=UPI001EF6158A|nr:RluA family pseudouridine synthase [Sporosarcina sp. ACRSM]MCG7335697.1 RluA family pseudouridine synthase [Sporosarcina sp. ACRSM]